VPEIIVYFSYALCIAVYLAVYFRVIIQTHFIYLLMAFGGFAGSILVDLIEPTFFDYLLLEDSFKFIGICCWMLYFWIYARKELAT